MTKRIYIGWVNGINSMKIFFKLNVDESSFDSLDRAGVGGTVGDSHRRWVSGFSGYVCHTINLQAEFSTFKYG